MKRKQKIAIAVGVLLAGVVVLLMAICAGGSSPGTEVSYTTCKPAQAVVFPTAENLPADLKEYQSPERGYSVRYPADWQAKPNQASYESIFGDVFFAPAPIGDVRPNVAVTCEIIPVGMGSSAYADQRRAVLEQLLGSSPNTGAELQVDGKDAFGWNYSVTSPGTPQPLKLDKVEVLFADDRGGWTFSLVVPDGQIKAYEAIFDALVESFHEE